MTIAVVAATILLLVIAAWHDVASRTIPNCLAAATAVVGLIWRSTGGLNAIAVSVIAACALFLALLLVYLRGALGGGDVKLATAMAFGLSPWDTYDFVVVTAMAGGVLALAYFLMRWLPAVQRLPAQSSYLMRVYVVERWRIRRRGPLPYGVAIAAGGVFTLVHALGR